MVLESIISSLHAERRPEEMVIYGFMTATIALLLSIWVFPAYASFAMVTFTVMAILPLMIHVMKLEKEKQESKNSKGLLEHKRVVLFFICLFMGFTLAFVFWFLLLPTDLSTDVFRLQMNTITDINSPTGSAISQSHTFGNIFVNNLRVLSLSILFSFIFSSGAIFILVWNASVVAVAMGSVFKMVVAAGEASSATYFWAASFAALRYLVHGIPEVTAYFIGGLAGGIISFTILDYKLGLSKLFKKSYRPLKDATYLIIGALILLVISALIEVFITPILIQ
ncbi:MAG: stage II sporulation protein M [archaeon]|nr:stage II sporulation protein M [Nanoarchaeota archaeon]